MLKYILSIFSQPLSKEISMLTVMSLLMLLTFALGTFNSWMFLFALHTLSAYHENEERPQLWEHRTLMLFVFNNVVAAILCFLAPEMALAYIMGILTGAASGFFLLKG